MTRFVINGVLSDKAWLPWHFLKLLVHLQFVFGQNVPWFGRRLLVAWSLSRERETKVSSVLRHRDICSACFHQKGTPTYSIAFVDVARRQLHKDLCVPLDGLLGAID